MARFNRKKKKFTKKKRFRRNGFGRKKRFRKMKNMIKKFSAGEVKRKIIPVS